MKSGTVATVFAGFLLVATIFQAFLADTAEPPLVAATDTQTSTQAVPDFGVDDLVKSPEDYEKKEITLRGVVLAVKKSDNVFAVIDLREFEACGTISCATNSLPVKFSGELPDPETTVEITGKVSKIDRGFVFLANRVTRVP